MSLQPNQFSNRPHFYLSIYLYVSLHGKYYITQTYMYRHQECNTERNLDKIVLVHFKIVLAHSLHDVAADRRLEQVSLLYYQVVWRQTVPLFDGAKES